MQLMFLGRIYKKVPLCTPYCQILLGYKPNMNIWMLVVIFNTAFAWTNTLENRGSA